jgi:hypothetical protein
MLSKPVKDGTLSFCNLHRFFLQRVSLEHSGRLRRRSNYGSYVGGGAHLKLNGGESHQWSSGTRNVGVISLRERMLSQAPFGA